MGKLHCWHLDFRGFAIPVWFGCHGNEIRGWQQHWLWQWHAGVLVEAVAVDGEWQQ